MLADAGGVMDEKQKKEIDIENKKNEFAAVETRKAILIGLAMLLRNVYTFLTIHLVWKH